jgi:tetratricopeptide (TPR) repeat protein
MMENELSLGNIMIKEWDKAIAHADASINGFWNLDDAHWPDFATVSKAYALMFKGGGDCYKEASQTLELYLEHRKKTFGEMDNESFKTGLAMLVLGDIRARQNCWEESFEWHKKTLSQYLSTLGPYHPRTAAVHIKIGQHHLHLNQYEAAEKALQNAITIYADRSIYIAESTRAHFILAKIHAANGNISESEQSRTIALEMLASLNQQQGRKLNEANIEDLVPFWWSK